MVARDPEAIQREIEATRAQLAESIDAIAEKLSPKRVASRGADKAKALVADAQGAIVASTKTTTVGADGQSYEVRKPLRTDRVAAVGVAVTATAVLIVVVRRRRRRKRSRAAAALGGGRRRR
jgi:C4-dicarboxylate-specific signal transduction histidine kinase